MANPPFNQKDWRAANELTDDSRWNGYNIPPVSNANYAWILHMVSKLSNNGIAAFILANGALNGGGEELQIRKQLVENNLVEAIIVLPRDMFYSTDISVTLWILNRNKKERQHQVNDISRNYRNREDEILFMDLRKAGILFDKAFIEFTPDEVDKIRTVFHNWQTKEHEVNYQDIPEFCCSATKQEVRENNYALMPSKYIEFVDRDLDIDFDTEMKRIQKKFKNLISEEKESQEELVNAFKTLGYGIS